MLVLSRKNNERLLIGNDVEVVVLSIQGNRVRLGIRAPENLKIVRNDVPLSTRPRDEQVPMSSAQFLAAQ